MMDENIIWQPAKVDHQERCERLGQKSLVVWLTGLSGSGKSTIAMEVEKRLFAMGKIAYVLDGDNVRHGINAGLGFTKEERTENIRRVTEVAKLFEDAGLITLVSFITPFQEMRDKAKEKIGADRFLEVYVKADFEVCASRDPKGLYKKDIKNFTGKESPYEIPNNPDIILDTENDDVETCVTQLLDAILKKI
ncbi:MAG: adenylyl-sulfate kinase [Lachnospiraceae bacterium]|nr:adenylyl-sulfate kinase [Lachnospiraceae bacterium]